MLCPFLSLIRRHGNGDQDPETRRPDQLRRSDYHGGPVSFLLVPAGMMERKKSRYYRSGFRTSSSAGIWLVILCDAPGARMTAHGLAFIEFALRPFVGFELTGPGEISFEPCAVVASLSAGRNSSRGCSHLGQQFPFYRALDPLFHGLIPARRYHFYAPPQVRVHIHREPHSGHLTYLPLATECLCVKSITLTIYARQGLVLREIEGSLQSQGQMFQIFAM